MIGEKRLIFVSIPLITYVVVSLYYSTPASDRVEVQRMIEKNTVYEDEELHVTVKLKNFGRSRMEVLESFDVVPEGMSLKSGLNHAIVELREGGIFSYSYSLGSSTYGEFRLGPTRIRTSDFQNSNSIFQVHNVYTDVRVLPKISYLPKIRIKPKYTRNWPGEILSRKRGSGLEFYGLTDYIPGDPVKRINWKVSSKFGVNLYTNQFMSELGGDTVIVLDARGVVDVGEPPVSTLSCGVRAAALIAYRLLRDRNRVGLVVVGPSLTKIFPGFGKRQFDKMLVALSSTRSSNVWEIRALGKYVSTFFSRMVQIIFVSPLVDQASIEAVMDIASRGYGVFVISPTPVDAERLSMKEIRAEDVLGERLARLKRENKLNLLRELFPVVDWKIETSLSEALVGATLEWNRTR